MDQHTKHEQIAARGSLLPLLAFGAILLCEYLGVSFFFDAQPVLARGGPWKVVGQAGALGPLIVAAVAATLLLSAKGSLALTTPTRVRIPPLVLHVALAGAFYWCTHLLFGRPQPPDGPLWLYLGAWSLSGLLSPVALFVAIVAPLRALRTILLRVVVVGGGVGVLAYFGGVLSTTLWTELSGVTFSAVSLILELLGFELEADYERRILGLEGFQVAVAPVCSGIEGLGLFAVLMTGFLVQFRASLRFPRALVLLPLGMLIVWLGNAVRIAALMILGARVDAELAVGSFHSKAGWVVFCAITIALATLARRSKFFALREASSERGTNLAAPWILPLLLWIGVALLTSSFAQGHDPLYGVRVVVSAAAIVVFWKTYREFLAWPSLTAWLVGILVGVLWLVLPTEAEAVVPGEQWSDFAYFSWLWLRTIGTIVIIPICEELAFRGYLTRFLTARDFSSVEFRNISWISIVGSSVAFGLLHDRLLLAIATGIIYALILRQRGRIIDPIAAHAASNAVIAVYVLLTHNWQHF